jgi:hydrogenase/urease accessory protein HupE
MRATLAATLVSLLLPTAATAHRLAPSFLGLHETTPGRVEVRWKTPRAVARGATLRPVLPDGCREVPPRRRERLADAWMERFLLACDAPALVGRTASVAGLAESGTDALLEIRLADGSERRAILTGESPIYRIPARARGSRVIVDYAALGIEHLATGPDHLLFVLGLLLLVRRRRQVVWVVTAFTAGHSITLTLAVLGFVRGSRAPVELAIAASLVVLAGELIRSTDVQRSARLRRAWAMAFGFGLLHGLGFAGALWKLGLPAHGIPLALFSFNLGIEAGQLILIAAALPVLHAARRLMRPWPSALTELPATVIGSLGAFWCFDRAAGWLGF